MKRTNKLLALLLAALMVVSVLPLSVSASNNADSVSNGRTMIYDADDFIKINDNPGGDYQLANDISFEGKTFTTPYVIEEFYGTLNGNGYAIKNLTLTCDGVTDAKIVGLIGHLGAYSPTENSAETGGAIAIADLTIDNMSITVNDSGSCELAVGFLTAGNYASTYSAVKTPVITGVHVKNSEITVNNTMTGAENILHMTSSWNRASLNVGGIVGGMASKIIISDCSLDNNTAINVNTTAKFKSFAVGGIVGSFAGMNKANGSHPRRFSAIDGCINEANIEVNYATSAALGGNDGASAVGGIVGVTIQNLIVTNCHNYGSVRGTLGVGEEKTDTAINLYAIIGRIHQTQAGSFVADCSSNWNNLAVSHFFSANQVGYNNKVGSDAQNYGSVVTITKDNVSDLSGKDNAAIYVFEKDAVIDLGETESLGNFNSVIYGNGATIKATLTDSGLFGTLGDSRLTTIYNLKLDLNVTVNSGTVGALATTASEKGIVLSNVDVKLDATVNGGNFGGMVGTGYVTRLINCDVSGTIDFKSGTGTVSAFVAFGQNCGKENDNAQKREGNHFVGCNSNVDISVEGTTACNVGGFTGDTSGAFAAHFVKCVNYGTITSDEGVTHNAGAIIGKWNAAAACIVNCADYGNFDKASGTAAGMTGYASMGMNNFKTYADYVGMVKGASIRTTEYTGIRFAAKLDMALIAKLEAEYGADAVSYGMLITPKALVDTAGEFTTDALDSLGQNPGYENVKMYYDIEADKDAWFDNVEGQIAGSITGLEGLYSVNLVGRAYIKVVVDGEVVFAEYSDYYAGDMANNTRSLARVARNAYDDGVTDSDIINGILGIN